MRNKNIGFETKQKQNWIPISIGHTITLLDSIIFFSSFLVHCRMFLRNEKLRNLRGILENLKIRDNKILKTETDINLKVQDKGCIMVNALRLLNQTLIFVEWQKLCVFELWRDERFFWSIFVSFSIFCLNFICCWQ